MIEKRLTWEKKLYVRGHSAYNKKGEFLGWLQLEKVGAHMHWCWYQDQDIRMSPSCLDEVRQKMKELFPLPNSNSEGGKHGD